MISFNYCTQLYITQKSSDKTAICCTYVVPKRKKPEYKTLAFPLYSRWDLNPYGQMSIGF